MAQSTLTRLGTLALPLIGTMITACAPAGKNSAVAVSVSGSGIVNGQDATPEDVAAKGRAESVVILLTKLKMTAPDGTQKEGMAMCTGTLIAPQVVLTAAHCVSDGAQPADIQVGLHYRSLAIPKEQQQPTPSGYRVKAFITNPGYRTEGKGGSQQNDLALVLLDHSVPEGTRLATLPAADFNLADPATQALLAIGYGQSDERHSAGEENGAGVLRYTVFPQGQFQLLPNDGSVAGMFAGMIAASGAATSVCHGDSGGPLMLVANNESTNTIIGINDAVLPHYADEAEQGDYQEAMKTGNLDGFYAKYPDAAVCSGGANVFVNVAAQLNWINSTKTTLLSSQGAPASMWQQFLGHVLTTLPRVTAF